jgi:hypothetical protein
MGWYPVAVGFLITFIVNFVVFCFVICDIWKRICDLNSGKARQCGSKSASLKLFRMAPTFTHYDSYLRSEINYKVYKC